MFIFCGLFYDADSISDSITNSAYRLLAGKTEIQRPLGRSRCGRDDNVKMDLRDIGWGAMDYIDLVQDSDHGNEPPGSIKYWEVPE